VLKERVTEISTQKRIDKTSKHKNLEVVSQALRDHFSQQAEIRAVLHRGMAECHTIWPLGVPNYPREKKRNTRKEARG
jgi:hypothetical protein